MNKKIISVLTLFLSLHFSYTQSNSSLKNTIAIPTLDSIAPTPNLTQLICDSIVRKNYREQETIYFRFNKIDFDSTYLSNANALIVIDKHLSDSISFFHLDSLLLDVKSSPEGSVNYNNQLSQRRLESLTNYLISRYPDSESKIISKYTGEDWVGFRNMVVQSVTIPNKQEVLDIIDSDLEFDIKELHIKKLNGGKPWNYITSNILPYLRTGASIMFYYDIEHLQQQKLELPEIIELDTVSFIEPIAKIETVELPEDNNIKKPLFALKTNLLFDVISLVNFELEVPIGNRWSIAGEYIFPWWSFSEDNLRDKHHTVQLLNGNLEGKYWFGNRDTQPILTGWYAGVYIGGGLYDLEYKGKGYQGELFIMGGVSGGYAHSINKTGNLRMEYSMGLGYMRTDYRYYESVFETIDNKWHSYRHNTGRQTWIGPTKIKVSLIWLLNTKRR